MSGPEPLNTMRLLEDENDVTCEESLHREQHHTVHLLGNPTMQPSDS